MGYQLDLVDLTRPAEVTVDGHRLGSRPTGSTGRAGTTGPTPTLWW
ncbi:MAG: hypothetical protein ACRDYE_06885 [Acidimicrobiales bacterium]